MGGFNVQRFKQFGPEDAANWFLVAGENTKRSTAMYPALGRQHIDYLGLNRLIFPAEPRFIDKTVNYWYAVVADVIYRIDKSYTITAISGSQVVTTSGKIFFTHLTEGSVTFACFTDMQKIYIYREDTGIFYTITDPQAPPIPTYIAAFGDRIAVSEGNTPRFFLSKIGLGGTAFDPATAFQDSNGKAVFASESGIIRQMAVLHNILYIFTDYTTGIWANIATVFPNGTTFPWKKNSSYDWDYGMADDQSLDVDFGMMTWGAQNRNGLLQVMVSDGSKPQRLSSKAVDIVFQRIANSSPNSATFRTQFSGFIYEYENTVFYRIYSGKYTDSELVDFTNVSSFALEYNFETKKWARIIELNGEKNRIAQHIYFNNQHLVTVEGEKTVYNMSGQFYTNEILNPDQPDNQEADSYLKMPMRYERVTPIISQDDYSEFQTNYVEIDFVWGESDIVFSESPFANAEFIITEDSDPANPTYVVEDKLVGGEPVYVIAEEGNLPELDAKHYNNWYKPHVELYWSDDGGISYYTADVREFSQMGYYQWRMRWYELGCSRNRTYKLICVSSVPIVVLGGVMDIERSSGGAN